MANMNHIPLTIDWDDDALHPALRNIQIYDANNVRVAEHVDGEYAAFIVRACNAHDALVTALESLMRCSDDSSERWDSYRQAKSALKLARGE
ncbi:hypothetical protein KGP36_08255 [Patescibacteria group bacterium]|nr:hypothetical protein [Patescibacteria group bacterium]